jgi:hypothetical protein
MVKKVPLNPEDQFRQTLRKVYEKSQMGQRVFADVLGIRRDTMRSLPCGRRRPGTQARPRRETSLGRACSPIHDLLLCTQMLAQFGLI